MNLLLPALLLALPAAPPDSTDAQAKLAPPARVAMLGPGARQGAPAMGPPAVAERLAGTRGKADPTPSAALDGLVSGNTALNVSTGNNLITNGAFANMSGLPVVIQNSGANVLIQNATVINLQLH